MDRNDRTMIFIDGSNTFTATGLLGFDIDYNKLLEYFNGRYKVIRAFYYTAMQESYSEGNQSVGVRGLVHWLNYNGYTAVTKPTKNITDSQTGRVKLKGNVDVEISVGMMKMAKHIDHAVLFSGDGDFRCLVEAVQDMGVRVTVISTLESKPMVLADELRKQADYFIELNDLKSQIFRERGMSEGFRRNAQV